MVKQQKRNRRKVFAAISATVLAAAIVLSGTFAWQSINQTAKNEVAGTGINPGGRLHDDFDGETKKVYVENFGEENIFARIRLDEYMELGNGAGLKTDDPGYDEKTATPLVNGDINDPSTWTPHKPGLSIEDCETDAEATDPGFHDYFKWTMGGQTVYMPTFDKNKDSLDADVNGTLSGGGTGLPYGDYIEYEAGDKELGNAEYDADDNTADEGTVTTVREEHTAVATLDATVITMQQWLNDYNRAPGNYWVYDVDGWAYWANPIAPNTATGLLLASIEQIAEPDEDWYYSINAVAQFATAGDWGKEDNTGFYDTSKGTAPTTNAEILLNQIAGLTEVTITTDSGDISKVEPGEQYTFTATVKIAGTDEVLLGQEFEWSVASLDGSEITSSIDATGVLTVSEEDAVKQLVIKATVKDTQNCGIYRVQVAPAEEP